jgi:cellulose synthase/poly-beta-1,6-N-acetylglucosamine synthase-like glycosyltransferase
LEPDKQSITQDAIFLPKYTDTFGAKRVIAFYKKVIAGIAAAFNWARGVCSSAIILAILFFIVINFYVFSSIVNLNSFFYSFLFLSLLTDGTYILMHLPRKRVQHKNLSFDPAKVTILIACYNGEATIAQTIAEAAKQIPLNQIIVVSDASTDKTAEVALEAGAKVIVNRKNMHKAFSISIGMKAVKTPYVLVLDDDTFVGDAFIPNNLLDEGYDAVAFNVLPAQQNTLINQLQQFEYRQSMQLGKDLRASAGAIGNVSGAIGLFRTSDLVTQVTRHSGQFAGEDEQRTAFVHLLGKGKGITYSDAPVITQPPSTYIELYRQRAYKWSPALSEMFMLYWRILLSPKYHYTLKAEKAYNLYYFLTDPLRLLFFWTLLTRSTHLIVMYVFYLILNIIVWAKLRFKANFRAVLLFPIYSLFLTVCRFIGHIYWIYIKFLYFTKRLYIYTQHRHIRLEYASIFAVIILIWSISGLHFARDLSLLSKIHSNSLNNSTTQFNYDNSASVQTYAQPQPAPPNASYLSIPVQPGDTQRAVAYKAIIEYLTQQSDVGALQVEHEKAYSYLAAQIPSFGSSVPGLAIHVEKSLVQQALDYERTGQ